MNNRLLPVGLIFVLAFALIPGITFAASLSASPNPFTLSNAIINISQYSTANTQVSGGSGGPYSAQWTWINSKGVNNQVVKTITVGSSPYGLAFNPSGTLAYVTNDNSNTVSVIQVSSNSVINTITVGSSPYGVAFNPSGTLAYVTNQGSGTVNVIQVSTNSVINTISVGSNPYGVAFNPSGTLAYVTNLAAGTVSVIQVSSNSVVNTITVGIGPRGLAFSPSGGYAYVTNSGSSSVSIINTATNTVVNSITSGVSIPYGVAFNPSGTLAYVTNDNDTVSVIQTSSNSVIKVIPSGGSNTFDIALNPSGTLAYVANSGSGNVGVIQVPSNSLIGTINVDTGNQGSPFDIALNPSGTLAYATNPGSNTVSVIGDLPETSLQEVPSSGSMQLEVHAVNNDTLAFTFNGVTYTESTGPNTVSGIWALYGFVQDNGTDIYYYGSNSILLSNTLIIRPVPLSTPTISPSSTTINSGQSVTFSSTWSGGTPTYGASLYSSTASTCNQQSALVQQDIGLSTGSVTFSPVTPSQQTYYCVFVTDNSTYMSSLSSPMTSSLNNPEGVSISPSGTYAYVTNSGSNNVVIIDTASNTVVNSITSGLNTPKTIAISPSGTYAYVTNCNSSCGGSIPDNVVIINTASNTVTGSITSGFDYPYGVSFSPSGTYAYVTNNHGNNVVIINTASNTVTGSITSGIADPYGVAFSPSGTYAYVTNYGSANIVIINTTSNTVTGSITSGFSSPYGVSFSPSGTYAYVVNGGSNNVVIINTATNNVTGIIASGLHLPYGVAFSPSGTYAYVTNCNIDCGGSGSDNVLIINTGVLIANSINSEVTLKSSGPQISNPYAGGPTGYFGPGPTPTIPTSTTSVTTVSTVSTASTTSTILPVTTVTPKIITVVNSSASAPTQLCNDSSGYIVHYQTFNTTFYIKSGTNNCFDMIAVNATTLSKSVNNSVIIAVNYTIDRANVSADVVQHYSCSIPNSDVAPFILRNGTWQEITPFTLNATACTVEFAVPSDPVIALLNTAHPNTTTTISNYTPPPNPSYLWLYILLLIIIIIIIVILLYSRRRRKRS